MIRPLILSLALITASGPALALSCMRPNAVRMFEYARNSDDVYYVVKGRIAPQEAISLPSAETGKDSTTDTKVQISGMGLNSQTFSTPVNVDATLRLTCLAVWCAGPPAEEELLMIVKREGQDLILEVDPCGGTAINWTKDAEKRLLDCHLSGNCDATF